MARVTDTRRSAGSTGEGRRTGASALSQVDIEQAAAFIEAYSDRPTVPIAVVIAAYNEEASVGGVVSAVPKELCGLTTEVIVVVDGARDATAEAARRAGALVCNVPVNRGQGAAVEVGLLPGSRTRGQLHHEHRRGWPVRQR